MSDVTNVRILADELGRIAAAVPGVARIQARPGVGRFARRVLSGLSAGPAAPSQPDILLNISPGSTRVELDIAVDAAFSAPLVVRVVAADVRARLALEGLPGASVDVRVVAIVG